LPGWYYTAVEVTTDRDGNVYIAGNSSEDTPASTRGWVRKYDRRGNQLGGEFAALPSPDVATDADDNVYTAAEDFYNGEWNVAKHSPQGKLVWSRDYIWNVDSPFNTTPSGVAADSGGNAYVTGSTPGPFGGPLRGGYDAWLTKWDRNGRELWRRQFGTAGYDFASEIAADGSGNLYITGSTDGSLGGRNRGGRDAWLAKYDRAGKVLWKEQLGTSRSEEGSAVATDIDGNIYVAGSTEGSLRGTNRGSSDAFVAKFAAR
jgi:hypothetical protein